MEGGDSFEAKTGRHLLIVIGIYTLASCCNAEGRTAVKQLIPCYLVCSLPVEACWPFKAKARVLHKTQVKIELQ